MADDRELIAVAEALGIPWRHLFQREINAEREIRRSLGSLGAETSVWRILVALQMSVLDSWRVRERLESLVWEACTLCSRRARRSLRVFFGHLSSGQTDGRRLGRQQNRHLELAYWRIRELELAARSAEKIRGDHSERVQRVMKKTGCPEDDARWAVQRTLEPRQRTVIEDVMRQARGEGFEFPPARTEFDAWVSLRRFMRRRGGEVRHRSQAARQRDFDPGNPSRRSRRGAGTAKKMFQQLQSLGQ